MNTSAFIRSTLIIIAFGFIGLNETQAQADLKVIPYGLGKIIVDANTNVQYQHPSYLSLPAAHFVKPQYTGNIESDKHLFEGAVKTWITQYPDEFKDYKNQMPSENSINSTNSKN